jgi:hypothetical protein
MHARGSSIIVPQRYSIKPLVLDRAHGQLAQAMQLLGEADERMHDLDERRLPGSLAHGDRGTYDRAHLHLVDLREHQPEPAAASAEHRVRLAQRADAATHLVVPRVLLRRKELVQRRVEQPDRDRQPDHRLEDPLEVGLLHRQQPLERRAPAGLVVRHDHLLDDGKAQCPALHSVGARQRDLPTEQLDDGQLDAGRS